MQSSINFQAKKSSSANLTDAHQINEAIKSNQAWKAFEKVRTTPGFWEKNKKEVLAMIQQLGPFTFFQTYSANDMHWDACIRLVAAHEGVLLWKHDI